MPISKNVPRASLAAGFLIVLAIGWAGCAAPTLSAADLLAAKPGDLIEDVEGTVTQVGEIGFGLVPDSEPGTRYAPDALPEEFRQDGLRVTFSGIVGDPAEGRRWGTPLQLRSIELLEGDD